MFKLLSFHVFTMFMYTVQLFMVKFLPKISIACLLSFIFYIQSFK